MCHFVCVAVKEEFSVGEVRANIRSAKAASQAAAAAMAAADCLRGTSCGRGGGCVWVYMVCVCIKGGAGVIGVTGSVTEDGVEKLLPEPEPPAALWARCRMAIASWFFFFSEFFTFLKN